VTPARMIILRTKAKLPRKILLTFYRFLMVFILQNVKVVAWAGFAPAHAIEPLPVKVFDF
jgi:hypothetical protein